MTTLVPLPRLTAILSTLIHLRPLHPLRFITGGCGTGCPRCGSIVTGGFVQAGNGNLPGFPKVSDGLVNPNYKNFGPRIGFAYQLTDKGNVVLRGGYGIFL